QAPRHAARDLDRGRLPRADARRPGDRGFHVADRNRSRTMNEWIEIPGGRFVLGLLPEEVDVLATASAQAARARVERDPAAGLREEREVEATSGNLDSLPPLIARAFRPHEVELAAFAIERAPVTNRDWKRFLADTKLSPPDGWSVPGADADE